MWQVRVESVLPGSVNAEALGRLTGELIWLPKVSYVRPYAYVSKQARKSSVKHTTPPSTWCARRRVLECDRCLPSYLRTYLLTYLLTYSPTHVLTVPKDNPQNIRQVSAERDAQLRSLLEQRDAKLVGEEEYADKRRGIIQTDRND